jgi:hypothetical protein
MKRDVFTIFITLSIMFGLNGHIFGQYSFNQIGTDIYGENNYDSFGTSISINGEGNVIAAGAPYYSNVAINAGQVKIFEENNGEWVQKGSDILGTLEEDGSGWSVGLNSAGDIVVIGLPYNQEAGSSYGKVLVYHFVNGEWVQLGNAIFGETEGDLAGWTVSINAEGYTIAVGAVEVVENDIETGLIRVYEYNQTNETWEKFGNDMEGNTINSYFGYSLDMNDEGNIVAAGGPSDNTNGTDAGIVKIYEKSNNDWIQKGQSITGNPGYQSGWNLSFNNDGSKIAIGSNRANNDNGLVQVFTFNNGNWEQVGNNIEGDENNAGSSVSLNSDGSRVSVGFASGVSQGVETGMLKVFKLNSGNWEQIGPALYGNNTDDRYGSDTEFNDAGDIFIVSAENSSEIGPFRGKIQVYQIEAPNGINTLEIYTSIMPNPFSDYLKINSSKNIHNVFIYDLQGRKVFEKNYRGRKNITLSVQMLKRGMYFMNFDYGGQSLVTKKIVKY